MNMQKVHATALHCTQTKHASRDRNLLETQTVHILHSPYVKFLPQQVDLALCYISDTTTASTQLFTPACNSIVFVAVTQVTRGYVCSVHTDLSLVVIIISIVSARAFYRLCINSALYMTEVIKGRHKTCTDCSLLIYYANF